MAKRTSSTGTAGAAPTLRQQAYVPARLRELLARGLQAGVLQVQAPAGCGKTAVVLQYLVDQGREPSWFTCVAEDAEPASLLTGLVKAMGGERSTAGQTTLAALASRDVTRAYRVALQPFLGELSETADQRVLVVDDADAIIASPEALNVLDYVVGACSPLLPVVLISRAELPLPSQAKRLLDGSATRIVADDLLVRAEEVAECAHVAFGATLPSDEAARLHRATGGWGIALRLALRLRELGTSVPGDERTPFTPEARSDLFAYLATEVLRSIDPRIAEFLRRTAVLETLEPAVCGRLTGEERPAEVIQSLASAGLPVMKAGWSAYRCHNLLREYFLHSFSETELRTAHGDAARAFAQASAWPQALSHFVAAGDTASALALADEHGRELFHAGHGRALLDLVKAAPTEMLSACYRAEYWAAFAASRMFELDWAAAALERVHDVAESRGDVATARDALRALSYMLNGWGRFAPATAAGQRLLDSVPEDDRAARAAVTLGYLTTGMGATVQFREAIDLTRRLLPELAIEPRAEPAAEAYARAVSAVTLALDGDFASARAELNQAAMLVVNDEQSEVTTFVPWSRALVEFQAGNIDDADAACHEAEERALRFGDLQRVLECRAVRASTTVLRGDVEEADRGFAQLDELRGGGPDFWGTILTLLSRPNRLRMRRDYAGALAAAEANHALAVATSSAWFVCSTGFDVANFRLLTGDAAAARDHARTARDNARALENDLLLFGAHLIVAATHPEEEDAAMAEALRIAEQRDYRFLMPYGIRLTQLDAALWRALDSDAGSRAAILLNAAGPASLGALRGVLPELGEEGAVRAAGVLGAFGAPARETLARMASSASRRVAAAAQEALAALEAANPHGLSSREREVLGLLAQGLRTKEIAERLFLTPATVSTHIQRIMNKTRTASRAELVALAVREGARVK